MDFEGAFFNSNDYELTNEYLNQGIFGKIRMVKKISDEKEYVAKIFNINNGFNGPEQIEFIRQSIILHKLSNPSIVNFLGINFQSLDDRSLLEPTMITEYLHNGSLKQFLDKDKKMISDPNWNSTTKCITLLGISNAMKYLHKHQILHRDLKPENILFDDNFYPHVSDYGLSKCFPEIMKKLMILTLTKNFTSPVYFAPELFEEEKEEFHNNLKVDVYSFGIIAFEILSGKEPYSELGKMSSFKLATKIISGCRPEFSDDDDKISEKMKSLIEKCLSKNIDDRPSFDQIFSELSDFKNYFGDDVDADKINKYLKAINVKDEKDGESAKKECDESVSEFEKVKFEKKLADERNNYAEIIKVLARNVKNVDDIEVKKNSLLQSACNVGNVDLVKYIMSLDENDIKSKGVSFLLKCFSCCFKKKNFNNVFLLIFLIKFQFFFINETILHFACKSGNLDLVKFIISLNKIDIKSTTVFYIVFFL